MWRGALIQTPGGRTIRVDGGPPASAYDAAYLALAEKLGEPLVTGDERLYNAVHAHLDWVHRVETYSDPE